MLAVTVILRKRTNVFANNAKNQIPQLWYVVAPGLGGTPQHVIETVVFVNSKYDGQIFVCFFLQRYAV